MYGTQFVIPEELSKLDVKSLTVCYLHVATLTFDLSVPSQIEDFSTSTTVDCILGISSEMFVLVDTDMKEALFSTPCKSVIGWTSQTDGSVQHVLHLLQTFSPSKNFTKMFKTLFLVRKIPLYYNIQGKV